MSKQVKGMMRASMAERLQGVTECLLVSVEGIEANENHRLRMGLRSKDIHLLVIQNRLTRRVFQRLGLDYMNDLLVGPCALVWGGEGVVSLAKEMTPWVDEIGRLVIKGGGMDGVTLSPDDVQRLSKLPSREELLGYVVSLGLGPAARVVSLAMGPASRVAGQIGQIAEPEGDVAASEDG